MSVEDNFHPVKSSKAGPPKAEFDRVKKIEEEVLEFWEKNQIFEKGQERRQKAKRFVFFEGPPTANGHPGIHHMLGRSLKDLFNRYKTMRGFLVKRKSGWDTHGLPVEIEVEKSLGLKSKKEIEEYGIAKFNKQAKQSVWKYKDEWERFTKRIGFWIDLKKPYITYDPKYIESLWHILKKVWDKKLLFKGHKVLPFCTRCGTPLSSHELAQGYKEAKDLSIYVKFKIEQGQKIKGWPIPENSYFLAWTTTPWTLPGNVALAVGKNIEYKIVQGDVGNSIETWIYAKNAQDPILAKNHPQKIYATDAPNLNGSDLVGLSYQSLFEVEFLKSSKSYHVYDADFITDQEGTGVVHTAVMYGEDDYVLGKDIGLPAHHTVNEQGRFTDDVPELAGKYVKDEETEQLIINHLKQNGNFLDTREITHDYPFCWRCGNPLLYYAMDSWFIGMSKLEKDLVKNNQKINWYPEHLKEGRFGEWLKGVKDWAVSRNRYWGTPLPIWKCQDCESHILAGYFEELENNRHRKANTFYLLRHGISTKNKAFNGDELISSKIEQDTYDLVPEGVEQIKKTAEQIKKEGGVDLVFSSPFLRTKRSAEIVAGELGLKVQIDERLKEIDYGQPYEGKSLALFRELEDRSDFEDKTEGGESWNEIRQRMFSLVRELNQKYEGKKILLVSHGDPLWLLRGISENLSEEEMLAKRSDTYVKKGQAVKITFANYPYNEKGEFDPHRPYIDEIILKCDKCVGPAKRISEVADVWFDSGAMPYAQWHYPFENKKEFKENYPADFISEMIEQTRGWFYTLLAISALMGDGPAYKNVVGHGVVLDEKGQKMSKSKGNAVDPWTVIDQYGADAARWYFYTVNSPGEPKPFSLSEVGQRLRGFVMTLWNSFRFFELYRPEAEVIHMQGPTLQKGLQNLDILDQWILSRLHQTIKLVTEAMDNFDSFSASRAIEQLVVEDFSKWWLRRSRNRLKENLSFFRFLVLEISKLIAPFTPFVAEKIYREVALASREPSVDIVFSSTSSEKTVPTRSLDDYLESVHWHDWPEVNKKFINSELEKEMALAQQAVNVGLALRKKNNLKVRQPLRRFASSVVVGISRPEIVDLIKDELNIKEVATGPDELDLHIDDALKFEGWAREVARQIQDMRKEAGYKFNEKVTAQWHTENAELKKAILEWRDFIKQNNLLDEFEMHLHTEPKNFDIQKEFELETGRKIWLGIKN